MKDVLKQKFSNPWVLAPTIFAVAIAIILGITMQVYADDAKQKTVSTAVSSNDAQWNAGRDTLANAAAVKRLGLTSWGTAETVPVRQKDLAAMPSQLEGLAVAVRLAGKEQAAFQDNYTDLQFDNLLGDGLYYAGYAARQSLVETDFMPTAQLDAATYRQYLQWALQTQGIPTAETDFAQFAGKTMNRGLLADMTYFALTRQADATLGSSLGGKLIAQGVLAEKQAVLADLPVPGNTEGYYRQLFIQQIKNTSEQFIYTDKNKKLMRQLMNDKTSVFAYIAKNSKLASDYKPPLEANLTLPAKSGNVTMTPEAYAKLKILFAGAKQDGFTLYTRSGYRSYTTQKGLYGNGGNPYRAAPGASEHQSGLAMDVANDRNSLSEDLSESKEAKWLRENACRYGFIVRYPQGKAGITGYPPEWWHLRYVGKTIAYECQSQGITYDEFYQSCQ